MLKITKQCTYYSDYGLIKNKIVFDKNTYKKDFTRYIKIRWEHLKYPIIKVWIEIKYFIINGIKLNHKILKSHVKIEKGLNRFFKWLLDY